MEGLIDIIERADANELRLIASALFEVIGAAAEEQQKPLRQKES